MLNDIVGIKISGANYITDTDLKIFNPKDNEKSNKSKMVKGTILLPITATAIRITSALLLLSHLI